jgi:hypothetical protein
MAMDEVLETTELLVSILQELDVKTLLPVCRVSRRWLSTIEPSPELQENLYYRNRPNSCEDSRYP